MTPHDYRFQSDGLTKERFLAINRAELVRLRNGINTAIKSSYGEAYKPVTLVDIFVLVNCEAGLTCGPNTVDPNHRHKPHGERGLLPLPKNIRDWNGQSAPDWDKPMPLSVNLWHFILYLGNIKNKPNMGDPGGVPDYRDIFRIEAIESNTARQARVIAGVVHGYFYSGNYTDKTVPFDQLIADYQVDVPLSKMIASTRYIHAGDRLLVNREANISAALELV